MEAEAVAWYELQRDVTVQRVGFVLRDNEKVGASPDGLVGEDGGLELKCPLPKTQVARLLDGELPAEYRPQVHGALLVTGRQHAVEFVHDVQERRRQLHRRDPPHARAGGARGC